jgi:hypothetical protein
MHDELGYFQRTNGLVMLLIGLFVLITTATIFRPQRPSSFAAGSGYGVGYGSDSLMVGASPTRGAAH